MGIPVSLFDPSDEVKKMDKVAGEGVEPSARRL